MEKIVFKINLYHPTSPLAKSGLSSESDECNKPFYRKELLLLPVIPVKIITFFTIGITMSITVKIKISIRIIIFT